MNRIRRFETMAERLVEGTFARLFAGQLSPLEVVAHLARAMEDHQTLSPTGMPQAPTHYSVYLHPDDHKTLADDQPALEAELARDVAELADQAGLTIATTPVVQLLSDEHMAPHRVYVDARWIAEETGAEAQVAGTREMEASEAKAEYDPNTPPPGRPFLIVDGHRHVNLLRSVISVGRALDNDVILEDPRVSRHHAQFRRRYGRYVLYDLGSSGGTQINDYPIEECVLHSGDVVSFAGVQVIYGEDPPTPAAPPSSQDTPALAQETAYD
jgi:pSer/pThr/pTyr-binding forkhead associated (FHA) protein